MWQSHRSGIPSHQGKQRNSITSHPSYDISGHIISVPVVVVVCYLVVHCMVLWLTGRQYLHVLVVQRRLTVVRPSQAFIPWCRIYECRILFAIFRQWHTGHVQKKQVTGEVSLAPGAVISGWFPVRILVARAYTGVEDAQYLSICTRVCKRGPAAYMGGFGGARRS